MRRPLPPSQRRRKPLVDEVHEYSQSDLHRLFHLSAPLLSSLARAGYLTPASDDGRTPYSSQDLLMLRTASALKAAKITDAKITAAIGNLRAALPPGSVFEIRALAASPKRSVVEGRSDAVFTRGKPLSPRATLLEAQVHYARAHQLEDSDVAAARAAYLDALNSHGGHLEARINLGRLLHLGGELEEAEKVYRQAKTSSALLSFNLGILLEDLHREEEAIAAYRDALAQDPALHDAHFNLARLHERAQQPRDALRHLLAFRRHLQRYGDS